MKIIYKVIIINITVLICILTFVFTNNIYIKNTLKQNITNFNKDYSNYIATHLDEELWRIKKLSYYYSFDKYLIMISNSINVSKYFYERVNFIIDDMKLIEKSTPFIKDISIYMKKSNKIITNNGIMDLSVWHEKQIKEYEEFKNKNIDLNNNTEKLYPFEDFILYTYPFRNNTYILVKIDKKYFNVMLNNFKNIYDSKIFIYDENSNIYISNIEIKKTKLDEIKNNKDNIIIDGKKYIIMQHYLSSHKLYIATLYSESLIENNYNKINLYTFIIFIFFIVINLIAIKLNCKTYHPIKSIINKYCYPNNIGNKCNNEFDIISSSFDELKIENLKVKSQIKQYYKISERNFLLRLLFNQETNRNNYNYVKLLKKKYPYFFIVSIVAEKNNGTTDVNFINYFDKYLNINYTYTKIIYTNNVTTYIIADDNENILYKKLSHYISNNINENQFIIIGISEKCNDIYQINRAYIQSNYCIQKQIINFNKHFFITLYNKKNKEYITNTSFSIKDDQLLIDYILNGKLKELKQYLNTKCYNKIQSISLKNSKNLCVHLNDILTSIIINNNTNQDLSFNIENNNENNSCYNIFYLYNTICNKILKLATYYNQNKDKNMYEEIINYINTYYVEDISAQTIADNFNITTVYLSSYFKKKSGMNLTTYLSEIRIKNALIYLDNTELKIKDIAEKVGIFNITTFNRQFKKYTGITPTKYRHQNNKG